MHFFLAARILKLVTDCGNRTTDVATPTLARVKGLYHALAFGIRH